MINYIIEENKSFLCDQTGITVSVIARFPKNKYIRSLLRYHKAKISIVTPGGKKLIKKVNAGWRFPFKSNGLHYVLHITRVHFVGNPYASQHNYGNLAVVGCDIYRITSKKYHNLNFDSK